MTQINVLVSKRPPFPLSTWTATDFFPKSNPTCWFASLLAHREGRYLHQWTDSQNEHVVCSICRTSCIKGEPPSLPYLGEKLNFCHLTSITMKTVKRITFRDQPWIAPMQLIHIYIHSLLHLFALIFFAPLHRQELRYLEIFSWLTLHKEVPVPLTPVLPSLWRQKISNKLSLLEKKENVINILHKRDSLNWVLFLRGDWPLWFCVSRAVQKWGSVESLCGSRLH